MTTIRDELTAAICAVIHPQPTPGGDRKECHVGIKAADSVLRLIVGKFRTDRSMVDAQAPEGRWTHDWDQLQATALICLGIDDPDSYGGLPGHGKVT